MVSFVILQIDGTLIESVIETNEKENIILSLNNLNLVKGKNIIEKICKWDNDNYDILLYGWKTGIKKNENKHELPPPIDDLLFYGDICCFKYIKNKIKNLSIEEYERFYSDKYGGFDISSNDDISDIDTESIDSDVSIFSELQKELYSGSDSN